MTGLVEVSVANGSAPLEISKCAAIQAAIEEIDRMRAVLKARDKHLQLARKQLERDWQIARMTERLAEEKARDGC